MTVALIFLALAVAALIAVYLDLFVLPDVLGWGRSVARRGSAPA